MMQLEIEKYLTGLAWVFERKNMNSFWPIGLSSTSLKYGPYFLEELELSLLKCDNYQIINNDYPTSLIVISLVVLYAAYGLKWSKERTFRILELIFAKIKEQKHGSILNTDGRNRIYTDSIIFNSIKQCNAISGKNKKLVNLFNELSALIFCYSEVLYYCNHRIGTEKHGPYKNVDSDQYVMVRSAKNIHPNFDLWPELIHQEKEFLLLPEYVELYYYYDPFEVKYDMFSNIIHSENVNTITNIIAYNIASLSKTDSIIELEKQVGDITLLFNKRIKEMININSNMSLEKLQIKLIGIFCYSCRNIFIDANKNWFNIWKETTKESNINKNIDIPNDNIVLEYYLNK